MAHAHADPATVVAGILDAVGNGAAQFRIDEVMDKYALRITLRAQLSAAILEVSDQFLLL